MNNASNSSKDRLVIMRNNGDNTCVSKVEDVNNSDHMLYRGVSSGNQVSTPNENDNILDDIMSTGRPNNNNYSQRRYFPQSRKLYSSQNEIYGPHSSMSAHSPSNNNGN
jgi:hypothetical protein